MLPIFPEWPSATLPGARMIALFPHCGFLSETSRMLAIHGALRAAGEPVCIATHGGPWESLLERAGVRWVQVGPHMDAERCARFIQSLPGIGAPTQSMYSDDEMLTYARAEADFMRQRGVRLAVTGFTLTTLLSTRLAGVPLAASHAGSWVPPVYEAGLLPAPSRPVMPLAGMLPKVLQRRLMNWSPSRLHIHCAGFNRAAKILGVERVPSFAALLLADLTLVTDLPEILGVSQDALERWRPAPHGGYRPATTLRYTGPLYARLDLPVPERVDRFLERGGPVAYVALTSSSPGLVRSVVAAARQSGCKVLVAATLHELGDLEGPQVLVEPLLASDRIMPRVAVAVVTGGQGSVQTAMASGVPMVGIPLQPEQDLNLLLAERQGMAVRLAPSLAGGVAMTKAVRTLLDQPRYREQAMRVQAIVSRVDGAAGAASAVRRFLAPPCLTDRPTSDGTGTRRLH
jgi:UDP:flavonoid glycosyltransferase YjiC (YdhE family)